MNKTLLKFLTYILPIQNIIVFESYPNYSDNTRMVYDEFVRKELDKKYKLIWISFDKNKKKEFRTYSYNSLLGKYFIFRARFLISCNRCLKKYRDGQEALYLRHGNPVKHISSYYHIPDEIDFCLLTSEKIRKLTADHYCINSSKLINFGGFPRNDIFYKDNEIITKKIKKNYTKIIAWYPTVKKFKDNNSNVSGIPVPIIYDKNNATLINNFLIEKNMCVYVKRHFASDIASFLSGEYSNIIFIDDEFLEFNKISNYEFLSCFDALLTDYSSVYYDFLIMDRPIGLVWEDIHEFRNNPGFDIDVDYYMAGGQRIYNVNDFLLYLSSVFYGADELNSRRNIIKKEINENFGELISPKIVDFVLERMQGGR